MLGRPDGVRGGLSKKIGPVGGFSSFDGSKVAKLGLSCYSIRVGGMELFGSSSGLCELFSEDCQSGVHQALDFGKKHERGAVGAIVDVSAKRPEDTHRSSWLGEEGLGGGGTGQFSSFLGRDGQSACCQRGVGLSLWGGGAYIDSRIRVWSEPVEERDDGSRSKMRETYLGWKRLAR